jgi:hypothetical protein
VTLATFHLSGHLGSSLAEDRATLFLSRLIGASSTLSGKETSQSRIYHTIDVLSAECVFHKVEKQIFC